MNPQRVRTGFVLLSSQAASSLLNFIPSAFAIATLTDIDIATMAVAITGYILAISVGRSMFGEAILVLSADRGNLWAQQAATTIRTVLSLASLLLLALVAGGSPFLSADLTSWILTLAVSFAMMSHDAKRYELIACRFETRVLRRDAFLLIGIVTALVTAWKVPDPSVEMYLGAWCVVALFSSVDLVISRPRLDFTAAREVIDTGRTFGYDQVANRVGILVVAIIARQAAGAASLADAEAQRLTMAVVNIAFLGAGPISLLGLPGRRSVRSDSAKVSAALALVATLWWLVVTGVAQLGAETLPGPFEPWTLGIQWKVLVWFIGAAIPFGYRYRMRTALAFRTITIAASSEAIGGITAVAVAVSLGGIGTAQSIFALYFAVGAVVWVIAGLLYTKIEPVEEQRRTEEVRS